MRRRSRSLLPWAGRHRAPQRPSRATPRRALALLGGCAAAAALAAAAQPAAGPFSLRSPAFADGGAIPARFTCEGTGVSPPLAWSGAPAGTTAFALIVSDPDAPRGTWIHWVVYGIPAGTDALAEGASSELPDGARTGRNDWQKAEYGGPCPPSGEHRYRFDLYALDRSLGDLGPLTARELEQAMRSAVRGSARLTGTYRKGGR